MLRPACCQPAPTSLTAHCVTARLAEPVAAITTITTVTEGNGTVLSEHLLDIEVDFLSIFWPLATQRQSSLAPLCGLADRVEVRRPSACRGRAQAPRAAERSAL